MSRSAAGQEVFHPTYVLEVDVAEGICDLPVPPGYDDALVLVRRHGTPLGCVRVRCAAGVLRAEDLHAAITVNWDLKWRIGREVLRRWLLGGAPAVRRSLPTWTVIVCTRDRTEPLAKCLKALLAARIEGGEILIVDNAPSDDGTRRLVASHPDVRYVCEPRPGLNWARHRGAVEATGEILLYTDDDVLVDRRWIAALLAPFQASRVGATTGLTLPLELETTAQARFEQWGGHGRGYEPRMFDPMTFRAAAAGLVGHGANMALRRSLVLELGLFACEMDVGTATLSGGDAYGFYRLLAEGYQIAYTPEALIWHQHRRDHKALRRMLYGYSVGVFAFLARAWLEHGDWQALQVGLEWFRKHHIKELGRVVTRQPNRMPFDLVRAEWRGVLDGPFAYLASKRAERVRPTAAMPPLPEAIA